VVDTVTNWFDLLKANKKKLRRRKKKKNLKRGQQALVEWGDEDWVDMGGKGKKGRYAPRAVAESLTPKQRAAENRKKREGRKKGKQHVPRTKAGKKVYQRVEGL
jgi:hypothetical protein